MLGCIIVTVILLLAILAPSPAPAQAQVTDTAILKWATVSTPGSVAERNDLRSPCEVNTIAVASDSKTIYAIDIPNATSPPAANPGLWKSCDGGIRWNSKPTQHLVETTPCPTLPVMDIALAPDDPSLVAVVCLNGAATLRHEVYFTEDGGTTWVYTGAIPWAYGGGEQIGGIAISPGYDFNGRLTHDIIVGSRHPDDGNGEGEIYISSYPCLSNWQAQGFTGGDVIALRASPNYSTDFTLVVMAATTQRAYLCLGYRDIAANECFWNKDSGWPAEMCQPGQSGGTTSGEDRIITGDIALPASFIGTVGKQRLLFAAYDSNGTAWGHSQLLDNVYRLEDTRVTRLGLPGAGSNARISTIAYAGDNKDGRLLAGEVGADTAIASARVWICHDPLLSCPMWQLSLKPPTGGGKDGYANAQIHWSSDGSIAFCATSSGNRNTPQKWADPNDPAWNSQSLDESAVSVTLDDGKSWNQVGLIDTRIDRLRSVSAAEDETTIYVASVNDLGFDSLWRSKSPVLGEAWQRVLCFSGQSSVLRLAPDADNGANLFWGDQGTNHARSSTDHGQTWHDCLPNCIIQDMAASDNQTLYILKANGDIRRGSYTDGWRWAKKVDTGLITSHSVAVRDNYILVGAAVNESYPAAYSSDGGRTWIKITAETPSGGNRHLAFDTYFETNQIIYIADDAGGIYRWSLGRSYDWEDLAPPNHSFYGIASSKQGAVYGLYSSPDSGMDRTLYSRSGIPKPGVYWDSITTGLAAGVQFSNEPNAISISDRTLWAIDARNYNPSDGEGCLWAFVDTLAGTGPKLIEPENGAAIGCDPVSGRNQEVALRWQQLSLADAYEIEIARDADFSLRITEAEPPTNPYFEPARVTNPAYRILPGALPEANTIYYWRARVRQAATGQVIRSRWSEEDSFSIKAGLPVISPQLGAQALRPAHRASNAPVSFIAFSWTPFKESTEYKFILAKDSALTDIIVEENLPTTAYKYNGRLDYDTCYFWQITATKPVPGEPSPVFSFTTVATPSPASTPQPTYHQTPHFLKESVLIGIFEFIIILILGAIIILLLKRLKRI